MGFPEHFEFTSARTGKTKHALVEKALVASDLLRTAVIHAQKACRNRNCDRRQQEARCYEPQTSQKLFYNDAVGRLQRGGGEKQMAFFHLTII